MADRIITLTVSESAYVRIIHGKAADAMRKTIRDALQGHPLVNHYKGGK